jgi:hypothetical protein
MPQPIAGSVIAARSVRRAAIASSGAARAKRATPSHSGSSQPRASFEKGIVSPQITPATVSAANALRRSVLIPNILDC